MSQQVEQVRNRIQELKMQLAEYRRLHKALDASWNELAFLTAVAYAVVIKNEQAEVFGISRETKTKAMGLQLSNEGEGIIGVKRHHDNSEVTIYLTHGGRVSFKESYYDDTQDARYTVNAFASLDEAKACAERHKEAHTSI